MPTWAKNNWQATSNSKPTTQDLDDIGNSMRLIGLPEQVAGTIQVNYNMQDIVNLRRIIMAPGNLGLDMNGGPLYGVGVNEFITPWTSDIDAAGWKLVNAGGIGVGNNVILPSPSNVAYTNLVVGSLSVPTAFGSLVLCGKTLVIPAAIGQISFANHEITVPEKRIAAINAETVDAVNTGRLTFFTWDAGVVTQKMQIAAAGVGIGGIIPAYKLDVAGDINISAGSVYRVNGVALVTGQTPWTNHVDAATFNLTNVGRMAVGTVNTPPAGTSLVLTDAVNSTLSFRHAASPLANSLIMETTGTSKLIFRLNSTDRIIFDSAGNVGIGTLAPVTKLTVSADATPGADVGTSQLMITGVDTTKRLALAFAPGGNFANIQAYQHGVGICPIQINAAGGNVGIGLTTLPVYKLDVGGDLNITGTYRVNGVPIATGGGGMAQTPWLSDINANTHHLTNVGKIAIGTSSPAAVPFHVVTGVNANFWVHAGGVAGTTAIAAANDAGSTNTPLEIRGVPVTFPISSVGIGLAGPLAKLHVAADVTRQLYLTSSSDPVNKQMRLGYDTSNNTTVVEGFLSGVGVNMALNPAGGNVGIGTGTPRQVFSIIAPNRTSYATADQFSIGEGSNNGDYRLVLGYALPTGFWAGSIQTMVGGAGGPLVLNPRGGNVMIGDTGAAPSNRLTVSDFVTDVISGPAQPDSLTWRRGLMVQGLMEAEGGAVIQMGSSSGLGWAIKQRCYNGNEGTLAFFGVRVATNKMYSVLTLNGSNGGTYTHGLLVAQAGVSVTGDVAAGTFNGLAIQADVSYPTASQILRSGSNAVCYFSESYFQANANITNNCAAATFNGYAMQAAATAAPGASQIIHSQGDGYVYLGYINTAVGVENPVLGNIMVRSGADNFIRSASPAHLAANLNAYNSAHTAAVQLAGSLTWRAQWAVGGCIFDASAGTAPDGTTPVGTTNPGTNWASVSGHPVLMGWNGLTTVGVRVDSCRRADSAATADSVTNAVNATNVTAGGTVVTSSVFAPVHDVGPNFKFDLGGEQSSMRLMGSSIEIIQFYLHHASIAANRRGRMGFRGQLATVRFADTAAARAGGLGDYDVYVNTAGFVICIVP